MEEGGEGCQERAGGEKMGLWHGDAGGHGSLENIVLGLLRLDNLFVCSNQNEALLVTEVLTDEDGPSLCNGMAL